MKDEREGKSYLQHSRSELSIHAPARRILIPQTPLVGVRPVYGASAAVTIGDVVVGTWFRAIASHISTGFEKIEIVR